LGDKLDGGGTKENDESEPGVANRVLGIVKEKGFSVKSRMPKDWNGDGPFQNPRVGWGKKIGKKKMASDYPRFVMNC